MKKYMIITSASRESGAQVEDNSKTLCCSKTRLAGSHKSSSERVQSSASNAPEKG
jgi:hypothetical protein